MMTRRVMFSEMISLVVGPLVPVIRFGGYGLLWAWSSEVEAEVLVLGTCDAEYLN